MLLEEISHLRGFLCSPFGKWVKLFFQRLPRYKKNKFIVKGGRWMTLPEIYALATDYNGTLVMDAQKGWKVFTAICEEKKTPPPTFIDFRELYSSGPFAANLLAHGVSSSFDELTEKVESYWSTFPPSKIAKGSWNVLVQLRTLGIPSALITRLHTSYAQPSIRKRNLEQFFGAHIYTGVEDKAQILRSLSFQVGPERLLFLTDTVLDIQEAQAVGCVVGAFTRGYGSPSALEAAKPHFLFDSWSQLFDRVAFRKV